MNSKFLNVLDHQKIVDSIRAAESKTTGEIRVRISHRKILFFRNEFQFTESEFKRLNMHRTPDRNGVLIMIFPERRKMVVLGDMAIHQKMGQELWDRTLRTAISHFKSEEFMQGILKAIEIVGTALAQHFPKTSGDPDSLPNDVVES